MSETTNTPEPDDEQGTFVGGSFGPPATEDPATTAAAPEAQEQTGMELAGGVEDASTEPAPGERNEPV